jgi:hypothetical protein
LPSFEELQYKLEAAQPDSTLDIICEIPDILRHRGLEEQLEYSRCLVCDQRGTYNIAGFDHKCNYFFQDFLPKKLEVKNGATEM